LKDWENIFYFFMSGVKCTYGVGRDYREFQLWILANKAGMKRWKE
jgi:hypothetical protein